MPESTAFSSWLVPRPVLRASALTMVVLLIPVVVVFVFVGADAGLPMLLAILMSTGAASRLPWQRSVPIVVAIAATSAVAVTLNGQPFAAACFIVVVSLLLAPANVLDSGLLAPVLAFAVIYTASPGIGTDAGSTALWTVIGGLIPIVLMLRKDKPARLAGITTQQAYRHAAVTALAVGAAVYLVLEFDVSHGYWAPLTMALVLQPFGSETRTKARQRIAGTIVGGLLALGLAFFLPTWAVVAIVGALLILTAAYGALGRYGQVVVATTPAAVLLANLGSPEAEFQATLLRVAATLVGAVIAAAIALLLEDADRDEAPAAG